MGGLPKKSARLLVQELLLLLCALTSQQQLQDTPQKKAFSQRGKPVTSTHSPGASRGDAVAQ